MLKRKEYHICDRCKCELESVYMVYDEMYEYELCDDCVSDFNKYKEEIDNLLKQCHEVGKKYQFGKYLPKEED